MAKGASTGQAPSASFSTRAGPGAASGELARELEVLQTYSEQLTRELDEVERQIRELRPRLQH
jgi:hypothetical protein